MFCCNCGNKVDENVCFCSKCGAKIRKNVELSNNVNIENPIQNNNVNHIEKNQNNAKQEKNQTINKKTSKEIRNIAEKYFSDDVFGDKTYLFDRNDEEDVVKYITRHYSLEIGEEPIFIFDYKENYEQGFLITTRRMIWQYNGLSGNWKLEDIGAIDKVKYMSMVDALMLFDKNVTKYSSHIVLTHIPDPELFVFRFALFLLEANPMFGGSNKLATILKYVSCSSGKIGTYGVTWKKLNPPKYYEEQSEKHKEFIKGFAEKIRTNLLIKKEETLFWGNETRNNGSNAYAFTECGVYYKNSNDTGVLSWEELKNVTIKILDKHNISIGNVTLEVDESIKEHFKLLNNLQNAIKWNWKNVFCTAISNAKNNKANKFILNKIPQQISARYDSETVGVSTGVDPIKYNGGNSVRIDKQVVAMKEALNIDARKNVFLMVPAGVFGNYGKKSKGFAIAEDGFYYRNDLGEVGMISWEKFLEQKIYLDIFVCVGKNRFNVDSGLKKPILNLLSGLQMNISDCINNTTDDTKAFIVAGNRKNKQPINDETIELALSECIVEEELLSKILGNVDTIYDFLSDEGEITENYKSVILQMFDNNLHCIDSYFDEDEIMGFTFYFNDEYSKFLSISNKKMIIRNNKEIIPLSISDIKRIQLKYKSNALFDFSIASSENEIVISDINRKELALEKEDISLFIQRLAKFCSEFTDSDVQISIQEETSAPCEIKKDDRTKTTKNRNNQSCNEVVNLGNDEKTKVESTSDLSEKDAECVLRTFATIFQKSAAYGVNCPILYLDKDENDVFSMSCKKINYLDTEKLLMIYSCPQNGTTIKSGEKGLSVTDQSIYIWNKEGTVRWSIRDIIGVRTIQSYGFLGISIISQKKDEEKDKTTIILDSVSNPGDLIARMDLFVKCVAISVFNDNNVKLDRINLLSQATFLTLRRSSKDCIIGNPFIGSKELNKIDKARSNICIPNDANIFLLIDGSMFGGWKRGVAFCDVGIVYSISSPVLWRWEDVMNAKIEVNKIGVPTIGGHPVASSRDKEMYGLLALLSDIVYVCNKEGNLI